MMTAPGVVRAGELNRGRQFAWQAWKYYISAAA
jgi:hypothetical protein